MSKAVTFTAADQAVFFAIFQQVDVGKIDKERLRIDLGLPTKTAARMRITRLKQKLAKGAPSSSSAPGPEAKTPPRKPAKGSTTSSSPKKRKINMSETEDEDEVDLLEIKDELTGEPDDGPVFETPTRRLPQRQARFTSFKEESEEEEEEEEEEKDISEDLFENSAAGARRSEESEKLAGSPFDEEA